MFIISVKIFNFVEVLWFIGYSRTLEYAFEVTSYELLDVRGDQISCLLKFKLIDDQRLQLSSLGSVQL